MANVFDVILKTIEEVQTKNKKNPNVETADPSVFDLIKNELNKIDTKVQNNQLQKGKRNPKSIFEMIRGGIEGVQKQNRKDPNVATAPGSVFDDIINKIEQKPRRQASTGLRKIVQDYNLDISVLPQQVVQDVQAKYQNDVQAFNKQYATAIFRLVKQYKGR